MVTGALKRRRKWGSEDDAYSRFRKRSLFKRVPDETLREYTRGITRPIPTGLGDGNEIAEIELAYSPEWEAKIFGTSPLGVWKAARQLQVPCLVVVGAESDVFMPAAAKTWGKLRPDVSVKIIPETGHLLPVENPEATAAPIREFLQSID